MTKIYVASSSRKRELAKNLAEMFEQHFGCEITHRWWDYFEGVTAEVELPEEQQRRFAENDLLGVARCDVLVILVGPEVMRGSFVEYGYALALNKHIVIVGDTADQPSIFWQLGKQLQDPGDDVETWQWLSQVNLQLVQ